MNLFTKPTSKKTCLQKSLDKDQCNCGKELPETEASPVAGPTDRKLFNTDKKSKSLFKLDVNSDWLKP